MDFFGHRPDEAEDDIKIVDHQIENHIDIQAARREYAEAVNFKEQRYGERFFKSGNRRIKTLEMASLQNAAVFLSEAGEAFGAFGSFGNRFFEQDVNARFEQPCSDRFVGNSRSRDNSGIDSADQVVEIFVRALYVGIDNCR